MPLPFSLHRPMLQGETDVGISALTQTNTISFQLNVTKPAIKDNSVLIGLLHMKLLLTDLQQCKPNSYDQSRDRKTTEHRALCSDKHPSLRDFGYGSLTITCLLHLSPLGNVAIQFRINLYANP